MSLWLALVVIAQIINAVVALVDKYIVSARSTVLKPLPYAFWLSVLSAGSIVIFLFDWVRIPIEGLAVPSFRAVASPTLLVASLSIVAGYSYFTALVSLFTSLKDADASDAVPVVGALTACFTLLLSFAFLDAKLTYTIFLGFAFLVLGTLLVSRMRLSWRTLLSVVHAGLMFGVHYVSIKALFLYAPNFDTAFFWSRLAIAFVALSFLLIPEYSYKIINHTREATVRTGALVLGNKFLAGLASILILKAIEHGDVSLVQALGGIQYVFLLIVSMVMGTFTARNIGEAVAPRDVLQKTISVPLIAIGFFLLFSH